MQRYRPAKVVRPDRGRPQRHLPASAFKAGDGQFGRVKIDKRLAFEMRNGENLFAIRAVSQ